MRLPTMHRNLTSSWHSARVSTRRKGHEIDIACRQEMADFIDFRFHRGQGLFGPQAGLPGIQKCPADGRHR